MPPQPMVVREFWVLLYPNGSWWCDKPLFNADLAQRTAAEWNSNLPRGERDRLRVAHLQIQEVPVSECIHGEVINRPCDACVDQLGKHHRFTAAGIVGPERDE